MKELIQGRVGGRRPPAAEKCVKPWSGRPTCGWRAGGLRPFLLHSRHAHKPAGLLSATEDRRQKTVLDLQAGAPAPPGWPFPVGRLDKMSKTFTDDGFGHLCSQMWTVLRQGGGSHTGRWSALAGMVLGTAATTRSGAELERWGRLAAKCHPAGNITCSAMPFKWSI